LRVLGRVRKSQGTARVPDVVKNEYDPTLTAKHTQTQISPGASIVADAKPSIRVQTMRLLVCERSELPRIADVISATGDWREVASLADRWSVFPALESRMQAGIDRMPADDAAALARKTSVQFFRTTVCLLAGCDALRTLSRARIPAVAFKGAAVIAHLHRGMRDRMIRDVDVFVRPEDLHEGLRALATAGFRRSISEGTVEDLVSFVGHSPGAAGNHAITLSNRQDAQVDLHWRLGGFDAESLIGSAREMELLGARIPVVSPAFGLLLTVHHALRNDLVPDEIARDILDCGGWLRLLAGDEQEMEHACAVAKAKGLFEVLGAMAICIRRLGGWAPEFLGKEREATTLADLYFRQLEEGAINTDLAYLSSRRAAGQIVAGAWRGWRRYRRMMRAFEAKQGEQRVTLIGRGIRLIRSVAQLSPGHWQQLRELTRAKDRMSP